MHCGDVRVSSCTLGPAHNQGIGLTVHHWGDVFWGARRWWEEVERTSFCYWMFRMFVMTEKYFILQINNWFTVTEAEYSTATPTLSLYLSLVHAHGNVHRAILLCFRINTRNACDFMCCKIMATSSNKLAWSTHKMLILRLCKPLYTYTLLHTYTNTLMSRMFNFCPQTLLNVTH